MRLKVYISATSEQRLFAEDIGPFLESHGQTLVGSVSDSDVLLFLMYGEDTREDIAARISVLEYADSNGIKIVPILIGDADQSWYDKAYGSLRGLIIKSVGDFPVLGQVFDTISQNREEVLDKKFGAPSIARSGKPKHIPKMESPDKGTGDYEETRDDDSSRGITIGGPVEYEKSGGYEGGATASVDRGEYEETGGSDDAPRGSVDRSEYESTSGYEKGARGSVDRDVYEEGPPIPAMREANGGSESIAEDEVNCTLYAPDATKPGRDILIEVFAHLAEDSGEVEKIAGETDATLRKQMARKIQKKIARGSKLVFELRMGELQKEIDEPIQDYVWEGGIIEVPFTVNVPVDFPKGVERGKVIVSANGTPVGRLIFKVEIGAGAEKIDARAQSELKRYQKAFISYSSKDRPEVLRRLQMLEINGIDYFQDVLDFDPGDRWEKGLYKNIDNCDVVFLFWSTVASKSEWIAKEIIYAEERRKSSGEDEPDIIPVIIEGPPPAPPPDSLNFLHFNDKMAYIISGADVEAAVLRERNKEHNQE